MAIGGIDDIVGSNNFSLIRCIVVFNCNPSRHELVGKLWYFEHVAAVYYSNMELN